MADFDPDRRKGLYAKYYVSRRDGSSEPGGKHEHCPTFVLDLMHDPYARVAARAYLDACHCDYPLLAQDLLKTLCDLEMLERGRRGLGRRRNKTPRRGRS